MRLATSRGRMHLFMGEDRLVDIGKASRERLPSNPSELYEVWDDLCDWATCGVDVSSTSDVDWETLEAPSPAPRQVFAIGLNYREHAAESGAATPSSPQVFTKFRSSIADPHSDLSLPSPSVDWEVELGAVIGRTARDVTVDAAWNHVAGLTVGQDFSDRQMQMCGEHPQFSLAKSSAGFAPLGPVLVTPDEFDHPDDLKIECTVNGELVQSSRTSQMTHSVSELIAAISAVCTLYPGDVLFTGTPSGVGFARKPQRYLNPGDVVVSTIGSIGQIRQRCV